MTHHPLTVAARRLDISLYTLRQWCQKAGIDLEQQKSLSDPRQKWLTDEQLQQLAQDHGRLLDQEATEPEPIPVNAYRLLVEQIAQMVQQAEQIGVDHAALQAVIAELREQGENTARLVVEIQQEQARSAEAEQHTAQTLGSHKDQMGGLQTTLEGYQQQTRTALDETNTRQQKTAEQLKEVVTASEQQGTQLAQLAARIDEQGRGIGQFAEQLRSLQREAQTQAEQAKQAEQRLQAQFQEALTALHRQMQEECDKRYLSTDFVLDFEQRAQRIEADEARDVATITEQQGQQLDKLAHQATQAQKGAEAANVAAQGCQSRLDPMEQRLADLEKRLQVERVARESLTQRLEALQQGEPQQPQERKRPGKRSARQAETTAEA